MDQNVSKKEISVVSDEKQGISFPRWFAQMFLGRRKNRANQTDERYFDTVNSQYDPLSCDDRCHPEIDLSSVDFDEEDGAVDGSDKSISEAKRKQQQLLEEFARLSGIELSPKSVASLRDSVEQQLEKQSSLPSFTKIEKDRSLAISDMGHEEVVADRDSVTENNSGGRVHNAYTFLVENEKRQESQIEHKSDGEVKADEDTKENCDHSFDSSDDVNDVKAESDASDEFKLKDIDAVDEGSVVTKVYDRDAIGSVLSELCKINSIRSIAVVGSDGNVLASNGSEKLDECNLGGLIFKSVKHFKRLGQQSGLGLLSQSVIEFKDGKLIVENLGENAIFIAVDHSAVLGLVRSQTKNQIESLKSILN